MTSPSTEGQEGPARMPNPLTAHIFNDPADADDYDGPPPSAGQVIAARALLDECQAEIDRARAILDAGTVDAALVGMALDMVHGATEPLTELAFAMHGMAG